MHFNGTIPDTHINRYVGTCIPYILNVIIHLPENGMPGRKTSR